MEFIWWLLGFAFIMFVVLGLLMSVARKQMGNAAKQAAKAADNYIDKKIDRINSDK